MQAALAGKLCPGHCLPSLATSRSYPGRTTSLSGTRSTRLSRDGTSTLPPPSALLQHGRLRGTGSEVN